MSWGRGSRSRELGLSPEERLQNAGGVSGCDVRQTWAVRSCATLAKTHSPDLRFPMQWQRRRAALMFSSCFLLGKRRFIDPVTTR